MQQETHPFSNKQYQPHDAPETNEIGGIIGVFSTHTQALLAINRLHRSEFQMSQISIIGRDDHTEENAIGYGRISDRTKFWGKLGSFWSNLSGRLQGSAFFVVPEIGLVVVAGSFISTLIRAFEQVGLVGGVNAFDTALINEGLPKKAISKFELAIREGRFLMIVHGSNKDLALAQEILEDTGAQDTTELNSPPTNEAASLTRH